MLKLKKWQEDKMQAVLNVFETGKTELAYDGIYIYEDGLNKRKQVTLSLGFTEDSWDDGGSLGSLLAIYIESRGRYANQLFGYIRKVGTGVLWKDESFKALLKQAAQNDLLFCECQDYTYKALYVHPARRKTEQLGLTLALSALVVEDSFLHGSFDNVRTLFPEVPPSKGGDEKAWIKAYCIARREWWKNHTKNPWKGQDGKGTYRMDCFLDCIARGNWELNLPINSNGVKI